MLEKIPVSVNVNLEIPEAILTAIYFFFVFEVYSVFKVWLWNIYELNISYTESDRSQGR